MKNTFRLTQIAVLILLVTFLASCKVSKDYQRPELALPTEYRNVPYGDTATIADMGWKEFFPDTTLQRLIDRGIAYNYDLQIALKRIDIAQQQVKQAKLLQLPRLDLRVAGTYNRPSNNSLNGLSASNFLKSSHIENYIASVDLSWEADIWGKIRRQQQATMGQYLQTYEATKAVQTRLVADIAKGFFNLLMLDKQLEVAKHNLELSNNTLKLTNLLKDAGEATSLSVQQSEAQREAIALLIPQLEQDITIQENALQILTGQMPNAIDRKVKLSDFKANDSLATGIPAALVSRRPDVRAAEMSVLVANAQLGVAQASMYPSLIISASGGIESFKSSNWFNIPGSLFGIAAGTIARPIFARRQLKTNLEVAKIEREQSVLEFRQSVLNAVGEVSNSLVQTQKLKEQEAIASNQVNILTQAISNAQLLYQSDMANYLEVITAQGNALQAELNLAFIRSQSLVARVDLYRSLGGGWK
ncbi:efflux transporter, outer membrane factor (OMF) lipoprotein, NodT family [Dyadobacter soli]|uniref:Efflux transporter, outer membrane factor (OMF) lipoprotein, NodT family n=1 Tax=Dyadobacter soli TaxID=659014 RepID=A0A1G7W618_9BACT|nr:efflux transporter outer membrane subunit [Dyadobacter soli]SDG66610.1 efflux transporter, outer membrane factor (OMF) lipoprotein, NodT family [Dyadobacter soli]